MKAVILGAGSVGVQVARQLISENKEVILIEKNAELSQQLANSLDCLVVNDEGRNPQLLKKAGVADADFFIALTGSDEVNLITCGLVGSEYRKPAKIARVRNPYYASYQEYGQFPFWGVDHMINPETEAAKAILRAIAYGAIGEVVTLDNEKLRLQPVRVGADSPFKNRTLAEIRQDLQHSFLVPVVLREDEVIVPSGDTRIEEEDSVYLLGDAANVEAIMALLGKTRQEFHKIAVIGGGRIGSFIAGQLSGRGRKAKGVFANLYRLFNPAKRSIAVFEQSIDKCKHLSEDYPDVLVNHVDVTEERALEEAQLGAYDLAIAVTGNPELNLVTAVQAKLLGVRKTIALVIKNDYLDVAAHLPIDVTISLKETLARTILSIIRRGVMRLLHTISDSELEILEMTIEKSTGLAGKRVREAGLPRDTLILFLVRDGETLLPEGSTVLKVRDQIGIITRKSSIPKLEDRFLKDA